MIYNLMKMISLFIIQIIKLNNIFKPEDKIIQKNQINKFNNIYIK